MMPNVLVEVVSVNNTKLKLYCHTIDKAFAHFTDACRPISGVHVSLPIFTEKLACLQVLLSEAGGIWNTGGIRALSKEIQGQMSFSIVGYLPSCSVNLIQDCDFHVIGVLACEPVRRAPGQASNLA